MATAACMKGLVCDATHSCAAGYVARPEGGGPYVVTLLEPWESIAAGVNVDIHAGRPIANRHGRLVTITGNLVKESEEIQAIGNVLHVLSERRLSVVHMLSDDWPLPDPAKPPFAYHGRRWRPQTDPGVAVK